MINSLKEGAALDGGTSVLRGTGVLGAVRAEGPQGTSLFSQIGITKKSANPEAQPSDF